MALDIIARATAASAKSDAAQALSRVGTLDLFTSLPTKSIDSGITAVVTSGYASGGAGGGTYVCDSLATAALAAAHPRFCLQSANGRYFRLSGDAISVEQGGAVGAAGTNDQPAIQATVAYANAVGIRRVTFTQAAYELWCPVRTSSAGPGIASTADGYPIYFTKALALVGLPGGSVLTFKNSAGGTKDVITQTTAWGQWQGGGIWVNANSPGTTANIPWVHLENLTLAGTTPYTGPVNTGANTSDKAISFPANGNYGVTKLTMRNVTAYNFSGELFYGGAFQAGSTILAENVELYNSQQSAWNPTGLGKVFATNLNAHDCYLASESISGEGHTYVACRFANASNSGTISTQFFQGGYFYGYPNRDLTVPPKFVSYIDCVFQNIASVTMSSWTRGRVISIDTGWAFTTPCKEVDFDIISWSDQRGFSVMSLSGPASTTTQFPSCPAGVYYEITKNIRVNIVCKRTSKAQADGRALTGVDLYSGLYDPNTVQINIEGEVGQVYTVPGSVVPGFAVPLITTGKLSYTGQQFGGTYSSPSANVALDVGWSAMTFYSTGTGPYSVTLNNTYGYADGQLVTFYLGAGSTAAMTFAATGAGMKLREPRKLSGSGDRLVLRWNKVLATWVEESFLPAQALRLTGSATYDAPSIAAGASATTTVTVTGAALGDYVSNVSLAASSGGLTVTGYVSAANTVTVVLANLTGAAVDLASTTLSVEVTRK